MGLKHNSFPWKKVRILLKKRIRVVPSPRVRGVRLALNEYKAGQSRVCAGFFLSRMEREREKERGGGS